MDTTGMYSSIKKRSGNFGFKMMYANEHPIWARKMLKHVPVYGKVITIRTTRYVYSPICEISETYAK